MVKGLIADILRSSTEDGFGIRTTVFLKGCPLNCVWCHNPECISPYAEELFYKEKCIGCQKCNEGCYSGARVICGKEYTADELVLELLIDKPYFDLGGGVTFSGGEALMQKDFLREALLKLKEKNVNCAVETSLIIYDEEIFKMFDFVMADLKIWNSETHKKYTGTGNEKIIENFKLLNKLNIPIIARTPIIPNINQEINKISEFLFGLKNVIKYELLPYHPLGNSKRTALNKEPLSIETPSKAYMEELSKYVFIR